LGQWAHYSFLVISIHVIYFCSNSQQDGSSSEHGDASII
jgi:hypothetical protein